MQVDGIEIAEGRIELPADAAIVERAEVAGDEASCGAVRLVLQAGIPLAPPCGGGSEIVEVGGCLLELLMEASDARGGGVRTWAAEDEMIDHVWACAGVGQRDVGAEPGGDERDTGESPGLEEVIKVLDVGAEAVVAVGGPGGLAVAAEIEGEAMEA